MVKQLEVILGSLQKKLSEAVQEAQTNLADVKSWFIKDAIEGISQTLAASQQSVEQVWWKLIRRSPN